MNSEKEVLLKLLLEKYGDEDLDECGDWDKGEAYVPLVRPPEVWEPEEMYSKGDLVYPDRIDPTVVPLFTIEGVTNVWISKSSYSRVKFTIQGGDIKRIAEVIWLNRCAGVETVGPITVEQTSGSGRTYYTRFDYIEV